MTVTPSMTGHASAPSIVLHEAQAVDGPDSEERRRVIALRQERARARGAGAATAEFGPTGERVR